MIQVLGGDMLRYEGAPAMAGQGRRVGFQEVHMLMSGEAGKPSYALRT